MIQFVVLTFIAYIAIDFAVYFLGSKQNVGFSEIAGHHAKMLPVYLIGNVLLTFGFLGGLAKEYSPIMLFGISMAIWVVSLVIVSMVLYKTYPNTLTVIGFTIVLTGVLLINYSIKSEL